MPIIPTTSVEISSQYAFLGRFYPLYEHILQNSIPNRTKYRIIVIMFTFMP